MKKILLTLFSLVFFASHNAHADNMQMAKDHMAPVVKAVAYHADWCSGCKVLGPKMMKAMGALPMGVKDKLKLVKLDFTSEETTAASKELAMSEHVAEFFPEMGVKPKTGQVKLIDVKTNEVIASITPDLSEEEIMGVLKSAVMK